MSDERIFSGSEFLDVLCDQALLSRVNRGQPIEWEWSGDGEKAEAMLRDGFWLGALVAAFVAAILDDLCNGEVVLSVVAIPYPDIQNLGYRAGDKCPLYQPWYVGWAVDHTTRALCSSPRFAEPFVLERRGRKFRFSRVDRVVRVTRA